MARKKRGRAHNAGEQKPQAPPPPPPPVPPPANASTKPATPSGSSGPPRATRKSAAPEPTTASKSAPPSPKPVDEPARPRPKAPTSTASPTDADTPSLISAVRDALEALETGCVPAAYTALLYALPGSDNIEPEKEVLNKIEKLALLVSRARTTMVDTFDAESVLKDLDEAQAVWTKLGAESHPPKQIDTPIEIQEWRVGAHLALGHYKEVLEEATIATTKAEVFRPAILVARMMAFFHLGRLAEAAQTATHYLSFSGMPSSQQLAVAIQQAAEAKKTGDEAYRKGQWDRAITAYTKAVRIVEEKSESKELAASMHYNLGMAHLKLDHVSSAVIHFSQAIEYDNSHVKALRNRASAYERMGYFIMAESDLGDAINLVDAEKDPKLHEYLKNELKRVEDVADEQERKREQAFDKMMRGPQKDKHYHTLGLKVGATEVEIKTAFKALAREHHPDKGGDSEKFKEVRSAYEALLGTGTGDMGVSDCTVS